ncbi:transcriptional regulator with XRE-family HTH domain [Paenibacillus polymyxa]
MSFGTFIKNIRKHMELKQAEVAEQTGIEASYLSKIEKDRVAPPSEEVLIKLAAALYHDPNEIIYKAGKIPPDIRELILNDEELFFYLQQKLEEKQKGE